MEVYSWEIHLEMRDFPLPNLNTTWLTNLFRKIKEGAQAAHSFSCFPPEVAEITL
jgi:hypothetical protein